MSKTFVPATTEKKEEAKDIIVSICQQYNLTKEQYQVAVRTVAKGATPEEFGMFMHICKTYALDPFIKEIFFYKVPNKKDGKEDTIIMTSRDGFAKIAQRSGEFIGINSMSVHANDEFSMNFGEDDTIKISHKITSLNNRGAILGAWARVKRKGFIEPIIVFVDFATYDKKIRGWASHPDAMIVKCAEAIAYKKAFGLSGLTSTEEMGFDPDSSTMINPPNNKLSIQSEIFDTIIKTLEKLQKDDPKKMVEIAQRELQENPDLTEEQRGLITKFIPIEG